MDAITAWSVSCITVVPMGSKNLFNCAAIVRSQYTFF